MRSTLKCDIILHIKWGNCFMKTKIIYISGNEVFDMNDIRAAFDEVRNALNLDKTTVLFGVPVDEDDTGLMAEKSNQPVAQVEETIKETEIIPENTIEQIPEQIVEPIIDTIDEPSEQIIDTVDTEIVDDEPIVEPVVAEQPKRRGRPRKEQITEVETTEPVAETVETNEEVVESDEKVVPILSVLSTNDENVVEKESDIEIIPEISDEKHDETIIESIDDDEPVVDIKADEIDDDDTADLEKLLSAMTPLDIADDKPIVEPVAEIEEPADDISVDATLEQLATEFAESQDKIAAENKSASRSKIGKLRNILPFKQSKHKDTGLGDLFGWAGVAANDEDFSVPGFFTNAAAKK